MPIAARAFVIQSGTPENIVRKVKTKHIAICYSYHLEHLHETVLISLATMQRCLRKERITKLFFSFGLLLVGISAMIWGAGRLETNVKILLSITGMTMLVLGILLLRDTLTTWGILQNRMMRLLNHHPEEIVWVYSVMTQVSPFGVFIKERGFVAICTSEGECHQLSGSFSELRSITKGLTILLPHASHGYTQEREQWFRANPYLLYNDEY